MSWSLLASARATLIESGITGPHQSHSRAHNIAKIHKLLEGDPGMAFGLSGMTRHSAADVLGFVAQATGCSPDIDDLDVEDAIDPDLTIGAIVGAAERLADYAGRGSTVLFATGHPTGVLEHNIRVADAYRRAGGKVSRLGAEESFGPAGATRICYVGGVACVAEGSSLKHIHAADGMEMLLEGFPWPDAVFADHGFAGAAIERGIPTIAIMDINDPALAVAAAQKSNVHLIPLDDNRPPQLYEPAWSIVEETLDPRV